MTLKQQLLWINRSEALTLSESQLEQRVESTIAHTFAWMGGVMLIAFGIAYAGGTGMIDLPVSSSLYWISWIAGLGIIFLMNMKRQSMSYATLAGLLLLFGVLEWYGLTGVFRAYNFGSIYNVFMSSTILFGVLALVGYHTKIDVARVWPVLFWSMIALIISLLINAFVLQSNWLDMMLSVIGIVIFSGFIIYDMNILRQQALWWDSRIEILMALGLFINFVNIFLFLLRLVGNQD